MNTLVLLLLTALGFLVGGGYAFLARRHPLPPAALRTAILIPTLAVALLLIWAWLATSNYRPTQGF